MLQRIAARIGVMFAWWMRDIRSRKSLIGKMASVGIGLFLLCCVCSFGLAAVRSTGQAVGIIATNTPTPRPTNTPVPISTPKPTSMPEATNTPQATETPLPSATVQPTEPPTATPESIATPTGVPTPKLEPTVKPAPAIAAPTAKPANAPIPTAADVGAAPCQPGQIKGNRNSGIYHAPGQRDYGKTQANVQCFDTESDAQAAGYRRAKR